MAVATDREISAANDHSFFDEYEGTLYELFQALDRKNEWRDTPEELLPYTQDRWVGWEHGNSDEKDQFTAKQEIAAQQLVARLGLKNEVLPEPGEYEQAGILGGMMRVLRERLKFIKDLLDEGHVATDRVVLWSGQRLRCEKDDKELEDVDMERFSTDGWISNELTKPTEHGWGSRFATEADLARLALLERFEGSKLRSVSLALAPSQVSHVPHRRFASYTFDVPQYPAFTILDGAAVSRPQGPPRPTTNSCALEWLKEMPPSQGSEVLIVAGNPHTLRNVREIRQISRRVGRPDIGFTPSGPAASENASLQLYLGEVGRLLYMDAQESRAPSSSLVLAA